MLLCSDNSIYTGIATNVQKRFLAHQAGKGGNYTRSHRVVKILHRESYPTKSAALKREAEIKHWPKEKKVALIKSSASALLKKPG